MELERLRDPFSPQDIEWRVSRAGRARGGIYCRVLAYITARAIQERLDEVCGPEGWQISQPIQFTHERKCGIGVGISILSEGEWITKWDMAELTDSSASIPPYKGGFSGAMKRAGAQWGIGRYLYHLSEMRAEVREEEPSGREWNWAKLAEKHGGGSYWWKPPELPGWALPKEPEREVSAEQLKHLKKTWRERLAPDVERPSELLEGFTRFVSSVVGEFPSSDSSCWTRDAFERCLQAMTGEES